MSNSVSSRQESEDGPSSSQGDVNTNTFPAKLMYMISELEKDGQDSIIAWKPHGRAFSVLNQALFVRDILPLWFRQSKFSSFQRQLNLYGFKRITSGPDKGCHYHEFFVRGYPELTKKITRTKVKGTGPRKPRSAVENEPNFYAIASIPKARVDDSAFTPKLSSTLTAPLPMGEQLVQLAIAKQELQQRVLSLQALSAGLSPDYLQLMALSTSSFPAQQTTEQALLLAHLGGGP